MIVYFASDNAFPFPSQCVATVNKDDDGLFHITKPES
jgi:hypothetical protein